MENVYYLINSVVVALVGAHALAGIINYIKNWTKSKHRSRDKD